ncbi:MAG TPA: gamma-glutamyltranspeptidase, partial [Acetobacteraceae bacterium]|nr:gamma-glutamyltranspeptidase [Acetobacteraceae bacterium]
GTLARRLAEASLGAGGGLTVEELRGALPRTAPATTLRIGNDIVATTEADGGATLAALQGSPAGGGATGAQAGLLTLDRDGQAVACAFSMNNLFGTGRVARGTGILLAAAPGGSVPQAPLAVALAQNANLRSFRASVVGTGQDAAPAAAAGTMLQLLRNVPPAQAIPAGAPGGRALAISCPRYLPGSPTLCEGAADPRGAGIALGSIAR